MLGQFDLSYSSKLEIKVDWVGMKKNLFSFIEEIH